MNSLSADVLDLTLTGIPPVQLVDLNNNGGQEMDEGCDSDEEGSQTIAANGTGPTQDEEADLMAEHASINGGLSASGTNSRVAETKQTGRSQSQKERVKPKRKSGGRKPAGMRKMDNPAEPYSAPMHVDKVRKVSLDHCDN